MELSSVSRPAYQHPPLRRDQIRILELLPGKFSAPISINLNVVDFTHESRLRYEALSYAWGSTQKPVQVHVENQAGRVLCVTKNLESALSHLRYECESRSLWIDAICIDQSNDVERSDQIAMMYKIYQRADQVLVWLGEEAADSNLALSKLDEFGRNIAVDWQACKPDHLSIKPAVGGEAQYASPSYEPIHDRRTLYAISHLLGRPWFYRTWVVQEVHASHFKAIVMCGRQVILWDRLCKGIHYLTVKRDTLPELEKADKSLYNQRISSAVLLSILLQNGELTKQFNTLWTCTKYLQCSDPRDRVLALQDILPAHKAIRADYTKSAGEIYEIMTLKAIQSDRSLHILLHCDLTDGKGTHPTWVPRFDVMSPQRFYSNTAVAASCTVPEIISFNEHTLRILGVVLHSVDQVIAIKKDTVSLMEIFGEMIHGIRGLVSSAQDFKKPYIAGGSVLEAWCRAITNNQLSDKYVDPEFEMLRIEDVLQVFDDVLQHRPVSGGHDVLLALFRSVLHCTVGKSLFTTSDGYCGTGSQATALGDKICVLLGCVSLLVVRPTGHGQYQVVGSAYVQGLENAEALLGPLPEPWYTRTRFSWTGGRYLAYVNTVTGEVTTADPRLSKELPARWTFRPGDDEGLYTSFVNRDTRSETFADPRLKPSELLRRGVKVETISLV